MSKRVRSPVRRVASGVMGVLFVVAAGAQWNDPDSLRWVVLYGVAGALAIWEALGRSHGVRWFLFVPQLVVALVSLIWLVTLVPTVVREASWTGTEVEREAAGLLLVLGTMLTLALTSQDV